MHLLDHMTAVEQERYFKGRAERMAKANLPEKLRLFLHPWHDIIVVLGSIIFWTMYGAPIGLFMVFLACWVQGSMSGWGAVLTFPLAFCDLALLIGAGVSALVR